MDDLIYALLFAKQAQNAAESYTDAVVSQFPRGITYRGAVDYYNSLPSSPASGDAYTVLYAGTSGTIPDGREYAYGTKDGINQWIPLGSSPSVSVANMQLNITTR